MAAIKETGVRESEISLRRFGADLGDLRPFWARLGESLATETQSPLAVRQTIRTVTQEPGLGRFKVGQGRHFRVESRSTRIRIEHFLFAIPPARREEPATPTPDPR